MLPGNIPANYTQSPCQLIAGQVYGGYTPPVFNIIIQFLLVYKKAL